MNEILINTTERIYLRIYVAGTATDADATPTVQIYEGDTLLPGPVTVQHPNAGEYYVLSSLADSGVEKDVIYKWTFTVGGKTSTKYDTIRFVTPYISLQEIKEIKDGITYEQAIAAERYARYMINSYVGQNFGKREATMEVKGNNKDTLMLPDRLLSIKMINENGVAVYDSTNLPAEYVINVSDTYYALRLTWSEHGTVIALPTDTGRMFGRSSLYTITGIWGWNEVPAEVNMAARMLAEDFLCRHDLAWQAKYVEAVSGADWKFSFADAQFYGTGNSIADRFLSPFVSQRAWGVIV